MRIVIAAHTTPQSGVLGMGRGISGYIYNLARSLVEQGHDVTMYVRDDYEPKEDWIKTVRAPVKRWLFYPHYVTAYLKRENADVFHSDFVSTGVALMAARKRPCVVSAHDVIPFEEKMPLKYFPLNELYKMRYRRLAKYADSVIFMSKDARDKALKLTGIELKKAFYVHNGVDVERFRPLKKKKREDRMKIGYLGGLDGRKNVTLLVEAFKILAAKRQDVELHVGGWGVELERFRAMGIPRTHFHGFVPEERKVDFYNSLDVFVFPSLREGFGMMLTEAMSCGLPVIGLDQSSTPEILGDAGLLVKNDVNELAAAIEKLVDNKKMRETLAKKARERALLFSWENCAKNTMKVYETVLRR